MMKTTLLATFAAMAVLAARGEEQPQPLTILADLVQADSATKSLVASGHVSAVHAPFRMSSTSCSRDREGVYRFGDDTTFTTCTNAPGHLHWYASGKFTYADGDYAEMSDCIVKFLGLPVFWMPELYMPLESIQSFRIMPGYTGRWGAYVLTKYVYHILGSTYAENPEGWGLDGSTRFDLRSKNGIALGETLHWRLGEFGQGRFRIYYAWDQSDRYDDYWNSTTRYNYHNWGSDVPEKRYGMDLDHTMALTERDIMRVHGSIYSDSSFRSDFLRKSFFMQKYHYLGYDANEIAWEHLESWSELGMSVSGPLNDFVDGTARLPEIYFDVNPMPVFGLPINYESDSRIGYLRRNIAKYGRDGDAITPYNRIPGEWAHYETLRIDTYHRLTAPMKFDDVLSVVPRVAFRETYWRNAGELYRDSYTGYDCSRNGSEDVGRTILEGGITFSARGTADLGNGWRHTVEPYLDVLAQKAWYSGLSNGSRPYVFDAYDASVDWSDQFASRGRNLPYTWYGFTPGVRNAFDIVDEKGNSRRYLDFDVYCAVQCNDTEWMGEGRLHRLAKPGEPNYGRNVFTPIPGLKFNWYPDRDLSLSGFIEYNSDYNEIALAGVQLKHQLTDRLSYYLTVFHADYRRWDFAASPYDPKTMTEDGFNDLKYTYLQVGFEHELCDAIAWSPYFRWDCLEGHLDSAGAWIDYRLDCLGFRLLLDYDNAYTRIDGSKHRQDFDVGFYIYLRAFGADSSNLFNY